MRDSTERVTIRIPADTLRAADSVYKSTGHRSRNDFIEKAIQHYLGYLTAADSSAHLDKFIAPIIKEIVDKSEYAISKSLYKLAVELNMIGSVVASYEGLDAEDLRLLRSRCEDDVRRIHGAIKLEDYLERHNLR